MPATGGGQIADTRKQGTMTEYPVTHEQPSIDTSVPHSARVWNYWLGGKDNYQVDREAGDAFAEVYPGIFALAQQSRQFLIRAVHHLVSEAGIRQFLDIGTGLPTMDNTHEVAERAAPECRIVYVDNDPLVLAHARALLVNTTQAGGTAYIHADLHDPDQVVADARSILNFTQPIGVMLMGVLGHVADFDESLSIVNRVMAAMPSGSYLAMWDDTTTATSDVVATANEGYAETGAVPYNPRSVAQIGRYFEDLELVDPGVVPVSLWRPNAADIGNPQTVSGHGAVARKP
jgi:hypothetical protein